MSIGFFRPDYVPVKVVITYRRLIVFSSAIETQIQSSVEAYLAGALIGEPVLYSSVWAAALMPLVNIKEPTFALYSVQLGLDGGGEIAVQDIPLAFDQVSTVGTVVVQEVGI